jgi:kynureninase
MDFLQAQEKAQELDRKDPLRTFRDEFLLPDGTIYLDGNSLGALSRSSSKAVESALNQQWGQDLIVSWNKADWIHLGQRCRSKLGWSRRQHLGKSF